MRTFRYLKAEKLMVHIADVLSKISALFVRLRPNRILSDDTKYKSYIYKSFKPELYEMHVRQGYENCIFCTSLIRSNCHKYCLKCSLGTYIMCYPPLPGLLYKCSVDVDEEDILPKPWYFRNVCEHFERLPKNQYLRNLHSFYSSISYCNYEALEGLEQGLISGIRPCYICASADYRLYKRCISQVDFDVYSPCLRIKQELKKVYDDQPSAVRSAG